MPLQIFSQVQNTQNIGRRFEPHAYQLKIIPYVIFSASSPTLGANFTARAYLWLTKH